MNARKRLGALLGVWVVGALGCGEADQSVVTGESEPEETSTWVSSESHEVAEPVEYQVFLREPVTEPGPGRAVYHLIVPAQSTGEQLHRTLTDLLQDEAAGDSSLVAIRAIAYVSRPTGEREANLIPVMWAEWAPPEGWAGAGPARRRVLHRVYTFQGAPPEW